MLKKDSFRILFLENIGTASLNLRSGLVTHFKNKGHEVLVVSDHNESKDKLTKKEIEAIHLYPKSTFPLTVLKYISELRNLFIKRKPDVIFTFTVRPNVFGNLAAKNLSIPVISTITGIGPLLESNTLSYKIARALTKRTLKNASKVVFQNDDDKKLFLEKEYVNESKTIRVPGSGVDFNKFDSDNYTSEESNFFRFLFIGRLIKDKGIFEFLEAAKRIKENFQNVEFHVIGRLWDKNSDDQKITKEEMESWDDKGVIIYHGRQNEVRPFLANADCFVLPSYREGISNVLLEASSMKIPMVTTDVTGCRDIVSEDFNGYLCKPKSVDDLERALIKMIQTPLEKRKELGENAREFVKSNFSKEQVISTYEKAMHEVIVR